MLPNHELHEQRILSRLERRDTVTQRALSRDLGIALGLTNLLMRRLLRKGWVRVRRVNGSRMRYLVTPAGLAAKARLTRAYVRESVRFYREARDHIRSELATLLVSAPAGARKRVIFLGSGEVAEIAYVCLQDTPLDLVGIVDSTLAGPFFATRVYRPSDLDGTTVGGQPFDALIVMPHPDESTVHALLADRGVPPDAVLWL